MTKYVFAKEKWLVAKKKQIDLISTSQSVQKRIWTLTRLLKDFLDLGKSSFFLHIQVFYCDCVAKFRGWGLKERKHPS